MMSAHIPGRAFVAAWEDCDGSSPFNNNDGLNARESAGELGNLMSREL